MQFMTIGYGDEAGYGRTEQEVKDAAHAHDEQLVASGAIIGVAGKPVQVRNHGNLGVVTTHGAFLRADLPIAGFGLIEADDLDDAIVKAAASPCAVADGVIEVWPLEVLST